MNVEELRTTPKVVGIKQTMRMVEKSLCKRVIIASDAEEGLLAPLLALCEKKGIEVTSSASMRDLGALSGIKKGAAALGIL